MDTIDWLYLNNDPIHALTRPKKVSAKPNEKQAMTAQVPLSIVQTDGLFVNTCSGENRAPKKNNSKRRYPIFITESPEKTYQKTHALSSSESEGNPMEEQPKKAKTREQQQLKNRISARNFRMRRKEYIAYLERKVSDQENTVRVLREENKKLLAANEELKQAFVLWSAPNVTTAKCSESKASLESQPIQFSTEDLQHLGLFDPPDLLNLNTEPFGPFFFDHAMMPDWNLERMIKKPSLAVAQSSWVKNEPTHPLLSDHPLLAPALMSILLHHAMSLEDVDVYPALFSESKRPAVTKKRIQEAVPSESVSRLDTITNEEIMTYVLTYYYSYYMFCRTVGLGHARILEKSRHCITYQKYYTRDFFKKMRNQEIAQKRDQANRGKLRTLQVYCKVATAVLKQPQRMTQIRKVLSENIRFSQSQRPQTPSPITGNAGRHYSTLAPLG
ncbi:hypothetical protein BY458DRAFT_506732 [Sporodiniella umbellata]|nr:hypothetical protein BY458DRAFT_506732 [Sporodiniella umbellata]